MGSQRSFHEILEEKLGPTPMRSPETDHIPGATDPANLAYLMGQIGVFRFEAPRPRPKPVPRRLASTSFQPRESGVPHTLTERQKTAMLWFARFEENLLPDFTERELKQAFRRLARRFHPDVQSGSELVFIELKELNEALEGVFAAK